MKKAQVIYLRESDRRKEKSKSGTYTVTFKDEALKNLRDLSRNLGLSKADTIQYALSVLVETTKHPHNKLLIRTR